MVNRFIKSLVKLCLNLAILVGFGILARHSYYLFTNGADALSGSVILIIGVVVWILIVKLSRSRSRHYCFRYKGTKPTLKLTTLSVITILLVLAFAGVQPFVVYKDNLVGKWEMYQSERVIEQAKMEEEGSKQELLLAIEEKTIRERQSELEAKLRLEVAEEARLKELEAERLKVEQEKEAIQLQKEDEAKLKAELFLAIKEAEKKAETTGLMYNGITLRNPTWRQLETFLERDDTDKVRYVYPTMVCEDFARRLQKNAKEAGWRCAMVRLDMVGYTDPYNYGIASDAGHACNAFKTTDRGLVYIDCTGQSERLKIRDHDRIVDIQIGQQYNPEYIFPSEGWYIPKGQMGKVVGVDIQW